jgi:hypothetical protein
MAVMKALLPLVLQAALVGVLSAQSAPAVFVPSSVYLGAEPSTVNPDWGCGNNSPFKCWFRQLAGVEAYAGVNQVWRQFGVEGDIRWFGLRGIGGGMKESNYVAGPTYRFIGRRKFVASGNVLFGRGSITLPKGYGPGQGSYWIVSPAARIEQRVSSHYSIRYEYEYQLWPGFTGVLGNHGLTPNGFGVGVTYHPHATL